MHALGVRSKEGLDDSSRAGLEEPDDESTEQTFIRDSWWDARTRSRFEEAISTCALRGPSSLRTSDRVKDQLMSLRLDSCRSEVDGAT